MSGLDRFTEICVLAGYRKEVGASGGGRICGIHIGHKKVWLPLEPTYSIFLDATLQEHNGLCSSHILTKARFFNEDGVMTSEKFFHP